MNGSDEDCGPAAQAVALTRGTRVSLARMGTKLGKALVDEGIMSDYRRWRVQWDAAALVREAIRRLGQERTTIGAAGTDALLIDVAAAQLMSTIPSRLPSSEPGDEPGSFRDDELGRFRTTALHAAVDSGLQLVAIGLRLDPSQEQARILNLTRERLHDCRALASRSTSVATWVGDQLRTGMPAPGLPSTGEDLQVWVGDLAQGWAKAGPDGSTVAGQWRTLAQVLLEAAPTLRLLNREPSSTVRLPPDLVEVWKDDQHSIGSLTDYLLPNNGGVERVCGRLLALHVAERGLLAGAPAVDQRVDLVQLSADSSDERSKSELGSPLMTRTLVQTAAVTVNAAKTVGIVPPQIGPVPGVVRSATRSTWWITRGASPLRRPWNLAAAVVTVLAGVILTGTGNTLLQALGLAFVLEGLIFLLASLPDWRGGWRWLATIAALVVVALLFVAAFIPRDRSRLFEWLGALAHQWQEGELAWVWFVVAALILLPALAYVIRVISLPAGRRRTS